MVLRLLFLCLLLIPVSLRAANPTFSDILGTNGVLIHISGTGGSEKLLIDGTNFAPRAGPPPPAYIQHLVWTNDNGDVYTLDANATNVLVENLEVFGAARMDERFAFGSTSQLLSLGVNDIDTSTTADKSLVSPTNDASQVTIRLTDPHDAQILFLENGQLNTGWTLKAGQTNSGVGQVLLQGGDFVTGNGTNLVLMLKGSGVDWQEVGRFWPGSTNGQAVINRTDGFIPYRLNGTMFDDSAFRMISGVPFITNRFGQDDLLKWQTTNGDLTIGLNTLGGSSFSSTKSMVINSSVGAVTLQSIGKLLTLTGNTFSPGESNALHFGTSGTPIADIWMTDSIITATNGVLYVNGVPVGGGPWTDDGTSIFPTANPSAMQLADDGSGVNFGIPIDGLARNFRFATDDGTNVSLVLFENTTTNQEVLFQYQPDYDGSGTIGNFDFRLIDDGANNGLSILSMMSKGRYTVIIDTNGLISVSANGGFHSGSGPTDSAAVSISYNATNGDPNIFEFHSEVLSTNGLDYAIQNLQIQQDENADGAQFQKFSEAASSILDVTDYEIAVLSGNQFTLDWTIGLNNSTSYWSFHPTITNGSGGTVLAISSVASLTNTENLLSLTNQNVGVFNVNALGELSLSGQTNLIGMSAGGQLTVDGVPVGGGSQTPWASDIDAAQFTLTNITRILFEDAPLHMNLIPYGFDVYSDSNSEFTVSIDEMTSKPMTFATFLGDLVSMLDPQDVNGYGRGRYLWSSTDNLSTGVHTTWSDNTNRTLMALSGRLGGAQISLIDTNGLSNLINVYASTNSGSAVLYTEGSPPTATVPIGNDGKYDFASGITVGGTNALTENIVLGLVTLTVRNGLIISHSP